MNVSMDVDSSKLRAAFAKAPAKVTLGLNQWIYRTSLRTEREAKIQIQPHVDTGVAQSSIHTFPGNLKATVRPTAKYAIWIHEGRKPGKMPPFHEGTELNRWATKRGMNPFLVARSIGRKGIKKHPFMDTAYGIVKPDADRDARSTLDQIVSSL